jgi:hypothetical protein
MEGVAATQEAEVVVVSTVVAVGEPCTAEEGLTAAGVRPAAVAPLKTKEAARAAVSVVVRPGLPGA